MKTLKLNLCLLVLFNCITFFSMAQSTGDSFELKGKIIEANGDYIPGANIKLVSLSDSTQKNLLASDLTGKFSYTNIKAGSYLLLVSFVGFTENKSKITIDKNTELADVVLRSDDKTTLKSINITATRDVIEQQFDKMVVNVENTPSAAGSTVLDVLGKSPGVAIDQNGNLSLRGKQGVVVMINDKQVRLSGPELAELLRGVSATNVSKVELIANPSAKFDASGSAGIINIKLKKDLRAGINGNLSLNGGHGKYVKSNNGGNINYNKGKVNLYGNYNYAYRGDYVWMDIERKFSPTTSVNSLFSQDYNQDITYGSHTSRVGMDYKISPKATIGTELFGTFTKIDRNANSKTLITDNLAAYDSRLNSFNTTLNGRNNYGINFNYNQKTDTLGSAFSADVDYAEFILNDKQTYDFEYLNSSGKPTDPPLSLYNDADGKLRIKSGGVNYAGRIKDILKFETGLKASSTNSITSLDFFNVTNGQSIFNPDLSNRFNYLENVQAAYLNLSRKSERLQYQFGLRFEATQATGKSGAGLNNFNRDYAQLFPSAALSYKLSEMHSIGATLSRRIQRPTYAQINPFFYFLDPSTRLSGNPELIPALSYSSELNYTFRNRYILSAGYFNTGNAIVDTQIPDAIDPQLIIQKPINIKQYQVYSLNLSLPVKVSNWFSSSNSFGGYYGKYSGMINNASLNNSKPYLTINSSNTFTLQDWSLQLIGTYNGRQFYGNAEISPVTVLAFAVQKKLFSKNATLSLNFNDIFLSNTVRSLNAVPGYSNKFLWQRDSRTAVLGFSYRFGGKTQNSDKRKGSAEDEKRRAG